MTIQGLAAVDDMIGRKRREWGERFDSCELRAVDVRIVQAYGSHARIRVAGPAGTRTGTVGITTGWKPAFILMHRSSDIGSGDALSMRDVVTHVQHGHAYVALDMHDLFGVHLASVRQPGFNFWGTDMSTIDADAFCPDCERELPGHYSACPGYAHPLRV
jgi:hypothetical protein